MYGMAHVLFDTCLARFGKQPFREGSPHLTRTRTSTAKLNFILGPLRHRGRVPSDGSGYPSIARGILKRKSQWSPRPRPVHARISCSRFGCLRVASPRFYSSPQFLRYDIWIGSHTGMGIAVCICISVHIAACGTALLGLGRRRGREGGGWERGLWCCRGRL